MVIPSDVAMQQRSQKSGLYHFTHKKGGHTFFRFSLLTEKLVYNKGCRAHFIRKSTVYNLVHSYFYFLYTFKSIVCMCLLWFPLRGENNHAETVSLSSTQTEQPCIRVTLPNQENHDVMVVLVLQIVILLRVWTVKGLNLYAFEHASAWLIFS